jgi:hypothetical protein
MGIPIPSKGLPVFGSIPWGRVQTLMGDDGELLKGDVEIDETSSDGKPNAPTASTELPGRVLLASQR